jgi:hypothetical protein
MAHVSGWAKAQEYSDDTLRGRGSDSDMLRIAAAIARRREREKSQHE